jgi:tellurite methyltransferase
MNQAVTFFSQQFDRQIAEADYRLNPFEERALQHLQGRVLDLGCGLGNLSIAAARAGCSVTAIDACPNATADLARRAAAEKLSIQVRCQELGDWRADACYDSVVAIGLLMFFPRPQATALLNEIKQTTAPGRVAIVNVLIEGTTYMAMFEPGRYCLFGQNELQESFAGWTLLDKRLDEFPAPDDTRKRFATVIARRPR